MFFKQKPPTSADVGGFAFPKRDKTSRFEHLVLDKDYA